MLNFGVNYLVDKNNSDLCAKQCCTSRTAELVHVVKRLP